jgi:signal transduction histidine kinase/uncharacterized protein YoaH (UPF0181 family)
MGTSTQFVGALRRSFKVVAHPHVRDRVELGRLAEEQAALRRVATLVARGASSAEVFPAVAQEVAQVMQLPMVGIFRYDSDEAMTVIAALSDRPHTLQPGTRWPLDGPSAVAEVLRTGRSARVEDYGNLPGALAAAARQSGLVRTAGAPIIVDGSIWGVMATSSPDVPLPDRVEDRLAEFTELLATAIANAESREKLTRLADEQAALRRVATLVAWGAPPGEVFEAVIGEVGRLVGADAAALSRYERDGTLIMIGGWSRSGGYVTVTVGTRFTLAPGGLGRVIRETGRPGRIDSYSELPGLAAAARDLGWRSSVGAPVIVEGHLWGTVVVASMTDRPLPHDTEGRLAEFTELMATAIANTASRSELAASRARIVATADATRRRIERDLHDGAQQQLVSLALGLRTAQASVPPELGKLREELSHVIDGQTSVLDELREIAQGIHPANLAESGLGPALKLLARRSPIPVKLDVQAEARLPEPVEVAAYYVVSEALTNAAKHSGATVVHIDVDTRDDVLRVDVRDDGLGGADPTRGSGLLGLKDRAEAIGGTITLQSPSDAGTSLRVELPLDGYEDARASG